MKLPDKYFLYVGNAYPHKNLEKLLEAFQMIPRYDDTTILSDDDKKSPSITVSQYHSINLILVGGEDYFYKRLKEKVKELKLEESVIFWGPATGKELNNLYKNALALVFPSLMEGFGLPGLEAMANGCPVICSDIPVFREVYGEAAIYFDSENTSDMASKIEVICYDDLNHHNKLIEKGFQQVSKYSWEKLARETLMVYREVC